MTILMDDETGLPALPAGQFWRVMEKDPYAAMSLTLSINTGPVLRLMTRESAPVRKVRRILFFDLEYTKEEMVDLVVEYKVITNSSGESIHIKDLTPDLIRVTADKIIEHQARIAKGKSYLGDYPPKKLEN